MDLKLFYCENGVTYPPFKNGRYLEEYFMEKITSQNIKTKRKYIPALWTNFQIQGWFGKMKNIMQKSLDDWVIKNPSKDGYFTVVQYDDACLLKLPENTIVYGACSGDIPIPLIYEDIDNKLENFTKKSFSEKNILCSFVGTITSNHIKPNVRKNMIENLRDKNSFRLILTNGWTNNVDKNKQQNFVNTTLNSKFALAPRGYGRSSFRFFEIFQLGSIPIYLWNDKNWLPFQDILDYSKFCIVLNISEINKLEKILHSIDESKYKEMLEEYQKIKHFFSLEGMSNQIIKEVS